MATKKSALSLAIGSAFAATIAAAPVANAADNPFEMNPLKSGYKVAGIAKGEEAKCGGDKGTEAKCGEDKDGEAKCGGNK